MITAVKAAILGIGKKLILAAVTEAVLKKVIIELLKEGAKRTGTKIDDEIVAEIEKALK
jgi:hypothetical protein